MLKSEDDTCRKRTLTIGLIMDLYQELQKKSMMILMPRGQLNTLCHPVMSYAIKPQRTISVIQTCPTPKRSNLVPSCSEQQFHCFRIEQPNGQNWKSKRRATTNAKSGWPMSLHDAVQVTPTPLSKRCECQRAVKPSYQDTPADHSARRERLPSYDHSHDPSYRPWLCVILLASVTTQLYPVKPALTKEWTRTLDSADAPLTSKEHMSLLSPKTEAREFEFVHT